VTAHTEPFTAADLEELASRGISVEEIGTQLRQLRRPPPPIVLDRPCTIGDGIVQLDPATQSKLIAQGDEAARAGRVVKFVPASGAATRMFKDLIAAAQGEARPSAHATARQLFEQLDRFPFAGELRRRSGVSGTPASDDEERHILRTLLEEMAFANRPKGLVPFHRTDSIRTAFEEHLLEGVGYTRDARGTCRMHFTISPEARAGFEAARAAADPILERRAPGAVLDVTFSEQHPSTDTIAIDGAGEPFRTADGRLLFRPAGHGALLRNIQDLNADIVAIKNIDNVLPHEASTEVVRWRRLLVGCLVDLQREVFERLAALHRSASESEIAAAIACARDRFGRSVPDTVRGMSARAEWVRELLDRPLRICGVVRNEGEPGGAPFWVRGRDGACSIQIVESSQVDTNEPDQARIFRSSTHFNPVDLVCGVRTWHGEPFDLARFVDPDTAFVVQKSADGRELKALERPGLWNGAMAGWNTVCVDVPTSTFAPVKTVADLLRPQHQFKP
jgi:hypothetical protein